MNYIRGHRSFRFCLGCPDVRPGGGGKKGSPISRPRSIVQTASCRNRHEMLSHPLLRSRFAPVMSTSLVSEQMLRTSHPSGSRRVPSSGLLPLALMRPTQSSVPNRVQQCLHRIYGSALAVQTRYSSRLGRSVNNNGRPGSPISRLGRSTPLFGSSRPPKPIPETSVWHHRAPGA